MHSGGKIGGWACKLFGKGEESEDDPIGKALADQEKAAEESAKEREKKLLASKESAIVAKLKAKFAAKENQLTLKNERRIAAWDEMKRKATSATKYWEKNKTQRNDAEMNAWYQSIEDDFSTMQGSDNYEELEEYRDLITIVGYKEDGTLRTEEEIKKEIDKDSELSKQIKRLKELSKKHSSEIADGIKENGEGFGKFLDNMRVQGTAINEAKNDLESAKKEQKEFNEKAEAVNLINTNKNDKEAAEKDVEKKQKDLDEFNNDSYFNTNAADEAPTIADTKAYAKHIIDKLDSNDKKDKEKIKKALKAAGFPEDIYPSSDDAEFKPDTEGFYEELNAKIDAANSETLKNDLNEKIKENYNKAKKELETAKNNVKKHTLPTDTESDDFNDYCAANNIEGEARDKLVSQINTYNSIPEEDRTNDTYTDSNDGSEKSNIEKKVKEAEENVKKLEAEERSRVEKRAQAVNRVKSAEKYKDLPEDVKDEIEKQKNELSPGETLKDGEIGYYKGDEFIKKPEIGDTEGEKKYNTGLAASLVTQSTNKNFVEVECEKDSNGEMKYYKVDDGNKTDISKEEFIKNKAAKQQAIESKQAISKAKNDFSKALKGTIDKDGKIEKEKYEKLTDEQKEVFSQLQNMSDDEVKKMFGNLELDNETLNNVMDAIDADEWNHLDEWDDEDLDDDTKNEEDNIDTDEKDTVATDKDGNEYIKVGDKWYKSEDIDDNGKPKKDAEEISDSDKISELDSSGTERNKKLENPKKVWKRKKKSNGHGLTKSYYRKNKKGEWISITKEEFDKKLDAYKKAKKKSQGGTPEHSSYRFTDFKHMLLESITEHESKQNINSYNKLKEYLTNNLFN